MKTLLLLFVLNAQQSKDPPDAGGFPSLGVPIVKVETPVVIKARKKHKK